MVDEFEDNDFDAQFEDDENSEEPDLDEEEDFEEEPVEEETDEVEDSQDSESDDDSGDEDQEFDKPVSEGDIVEVEIDDLGSKGDGIARVEGFVVFVPGGEVGESYDVEITSVGNKFAFAEIAE